MNNKFRASYSVLRLWEESRVDDAIKAYFRLDRWVSEQMADGKDWHEKWAEEIRQTSKTPAIFGGRELITPVVEKKIVVPIFDWLDLSFVMDCYASNVLYEWKTGLSNSQDYVRMPQISVYALGCALAELPAKKAEIHHYNQYNKQADMSIIWLTNKLVKSGYDYVLTFASEMHNYFVDNNLYASLGSGIDGKGGK